ncbi:hypothetical protein E4S40_00085 [Algoriphagus kandeliae]|uniref:Uncharacterized protein n=1 Tax=Algoriphagus kandeliae TaxID=2562278 RepID=A0A4Y9R0X4_9BACT|nr:hypothetical protein [Algoriphagus kandeliae]TFV97093.1 hypothetical protein E4S40_00085 [Algoriphagus kandeliae]
MEIKTPLSIKFHLPDEIMREYNCPVLARDFWPGQEESLMCDSLDGDPSLVTIDLTKILDWLRQEELPKPLEKEVCDIPVLLFVPDFSTNHLLFHYDGTPQSAQLIRHFINLFQNKIKNSKATIISPSFIPKSKIKEEQELIQLVAKSTRETSFIKFNFMRIGDFWSYAVKHHCTLLVTTKNYQSDLTKVLYHFYKSKLWSDQLSFYLSI